MSDHRLSAILVTDEPGQSLDRILSRYASQTVAREMEVIVASSVADSLVIRPDHRRTFGDLRVIRADTTTSATARVAAVKAASAPFVILGEDHCFPIADGWAAKFLEDFAQGYAAVGPVMRNANPNSAASRENLAVEYAPWMHADAPREADYLPGQNSGYRRDLLLGYGDALCDMLEAEWVMHADMRRQGHRLLLDPRIEVAHLNYSRVTRSLRLHFLAGRMFAASRARNWTRARQFAYAAAAPAIPVKRFVAILRDLMPAAETRRQTVGALPLLALFLAASAAGECLGYLLGDGGRREALAKMEYRRWRNLLPDETHLAH